MRSLVLAFAVLAVLAVAAPAARAGGLSASAGDRYGATTGIVAGRPAVIVSTLYLSESGEGCARPRSLRAALDPPRGMSVRGPRTMSRRGRRVNATWHVRAARAGVRWGYVRWRGTGEDGRRCTGTQHLRVVVTSAPPSLEVVAAVRRFEATGVIVRAALPGVRAPAAEAFDTFFNEQHVLGRARRGLRALLDPRPHLGDRFDKDGLSCLLVQDTRPSIAYRLRFTWNHAIGAVNVVRSGTLPVALEPRNFTERACERQYRPVPECSPCDATGSSVASFAKPMTAAAEQITSRP
jgi:hypothetical protein